MFTAAALGILRKQHFPIGTKGTRVQKLIFTNHSYVLYHDQKYSFQKALYSSSDAFSLYITWD